MTRQSSHYRGRFAPSPSGPLHMGSLVAATGSYLQAKAQHGKWLVRIEDIDPPREMPGAADNILRCLEAHGLYWDESVRYQSQQSQYYDAQLDDLRQAGLTYYCNCTRKQIQQSGGHYNGHCRQLKHAAAGCSIRLNNQSPVAQFNDLLLGRIDADMAFAAEDFILKRKDGLYAYHLAVVCDDIDQGITQIVRGSDLLQPTACQLALYHLFNQPPPEYLHLPVMVTAPGIKLSKQNHATALDNNQASHNLWQVLCHLEHRPPLELQQASCEQLLAWALAHWQIEQLPRQTERQQAQ